MGDSQVLYTSVICGWTNPSEKKKNNSSNWIMKPQKFGMNIKQKLSYHHL